LPGNGGDYHRTLSPTLTLPCFVPGEKILEMANYHGANLSDYDRVALIVNCADYHTIGGVYTGSGEIGVPLVRTVGNHGRLKINDFTGYTTFSRGVVWNILHEIGHSFPYRMAHSNILDCDDKIIWTNCTHIEYRDNFDIMGSKGGIFNAWRQEATGWI